MTVEDIARDLSVAEDTVRGWIREKKLPAYRVGKRNFLTKLINERQYILCFQYIRFAQCLLNTTHVCLQKFVFFI